jgi:hypothetical protein
MKVYLHSDNAEGRAAYSVYLAPAADLDFHSAEKYDAAGFPKSWLNGSGEPKQIEVVFAFGGATVPDELGRYMVARGIAHKHRLLRRVRQFYDAMGKPIEMLFDEHGQRVMYDNPQAA